MQSFISSPLPNHRKCSSYSVPPEVNGGGGVPPMHIQVSLWSPTGEFGAVMEGQLNQDDSVLKVAVKTMKSEYVHTCAPMWEPHPITSGPSPVPLRR